jgi:GNAT superfamily N-acetyltransferase
VSDSVLTEELPIYRSFESGDLPYAHTLSIALQWPHRPEDWQLALETGRGFVAECRGKLVGTALCWKYGADAATLGLVIVDPSQQARGIGRRLIELILNEVGDRTIFLYATPQGAPLYRKLGFKDCGSLDQRQGPVNAATLEQFALNPGEKLRLATAADLAQIRRVFSEASGFDWSAILPPLLGASEAAVIERAGEILGVSLLRRFGHGLAIGPAAVRVSNNSRLHAKALIARWLSDHPGEFIRIDLPVEAGFDQWLDQVGLMRVGTVTRMVRGSLHQSGKDKSKDAFRSFAIINQAMG